MEVTKADAKPEAEQEEVDQMRDTDERSASLVMSPPPPGKEAWTKKEKKIGSEDAKSATKGREGGGW